MSILAEKRPLTPRQREVFDFIIEFTIEHGYQPTYAEMSEVFGGKPENMRDLVRRMVARGHIAPPTGKYQRALVIPELKRRLAAALEN